MGLYNWTRSEYEQHRSHPVQHAMPANQPNDDWRQWKNGLSAAVDDNTEFVQSLNCLTRKMLKFYVIEIMWSFSLQLEAKLYQSSGNNQYVLYPIRLPTMTMCEFLNGPYRKFFMEASKPPVTNFPYSEDPNEDLCKQIMSDKDVRSNNQWRFKSKR